jgi:hypothetical protein
MKKGLLITAILFYNGYLFAQTATDPDTVKYWHNTGQINLSFSQISLTNWAAGGDNSIAANGLVRLEADYSKNKTSWDSYILTGYGVSKIGSEGFFKNDDKLELLSKYGYKAGKNWFYSVVLNAKTQFAPGYKSKEDRTNKISDFLSPAYLTAAIGMDYKPNADFALFLSPISTRYTTVIDDSLSAAGAFGVDPGKKLRTEFGGYIKLIYKKDNIIQNVNIGTNLDLFTNYLEHPERVDVNWDLLLTMKINKFLAVTLNTQLIYDYDTKFTEIVDNVQVQKAKVQFKESLGLGISANF